MQNLEKEKSNSESDEVEINPMVSGLENDDQSVRYEELRQRLHREIEDFDEVEIAVSQRDQRRGGRRKRFCKRNARGNLGLKKRSQAQVLHRKAWRRMWKKLQMSSSSVMLEEEEEEEEVTRFADSN
ncbi:hypothetical protein OIU78_007378 [Salix suchowensis]|nr:hypothetical protein OIU78_007378 [Salix suchowensis]